MSGADRDDRHRGIWIGSFGGQNRRITTRPFKERERAGSMRGFNSPALSLRFLERVQHEPPYTRNAARPGRPPGRDPFPVSGGCRTVHEMHCQAAFDTHGHPGAAAPKAGTTPGLRLESCLRPAAGRRRVKCRSKCGRWKSNSLPTPGGS